MALVTAYLARTAQRNAGRTTASGARNLIDRLTSFIRAACIAMSEARELRRVMTQNSPFIDI
jgi:hypothetical protein